MGGISDDDKAYLKSWPGLETPEKREKWKKWCSDHESKSVRGKQHLILVQTKVETDLTMLDWYQNKVSNPWHLPSLHPALTKIEHHVWIMTPKTTNIVETAHAATNALTGINLPILQAILS